MIQDTGITYRIDQALKLVDTTKVVKISHGAISYLDKYLAEFFKGKPAVIIADTNTYNAAGISVIEHLNTKGYQTGTPVIFEEEKLYAEMQHVERLHAYLSNNDFVPIAIGSGTLNDITKLAAYRCLKPFAAIPTAASVDGYTAFGASISYKGSKQTFNCPAPLVVLADMDIITAAPKELNAAGYADLIAKIPSGADWIIADALGIEPLHDLAWDMTQKNLKRMIDNPSGIKTADDTALMYLIEGLVMTGLGMQISKNSRPASGAEHQFSHLWDTQGHKFKGLVPLHGFKVGIGTLASESLYEQFLTNEAKDFCIERSSIVKRCQSISELESKIHQHFTDKDLAEQAIEQCKAKYIDEDDLYERALLLRSVWPELKVKLEDQLLGAQNIRRMLYEAGAPTNPEEIGIDRQRLKTSYEQAQLIRKRYTILDLVMETDMWAKCVDPLFREGGFWSLE